MTFYQDKIKQFISNQTYKTQTDVAEQEIGVDGSNDEGFNGKEEIQVVNSRTTKIDLSSARHSSSHGLEEWLGRVNQHLNTTTTPSRASPTESSPRYSHKQNCLRFAFLPLTASLNEGISDEFFVFPLILPSKGDRIQ